MKIEETIKVEKSEDGEYNIKELLLGRELNVDRWDFEQEKEGKGTHQLFFTITDIPPKETFIKEWKTQDGKVRSTVIVYVDFCGKQLPFALNQSSYKNLAALWGSNVQDWVGKQGTCMIKSIAGKRYLEAVPTTNKMEGVEGVGGSD